MTLQIYADRKIAELESRVEAEARKTLENGHADAIHDLRVSIRRLTQALRAFESLVGKQRVKQARRRLRRWMDAAAEIRNRDIALELLAASGIEADSSIAQRVIAEREAAHGRLAQLLAEKSA
ncbi:MAG: CHAD domain-containing protein [Bryobacteraceae bacterium]